jgi:hypothetical protein
MFMEQDGQALADEESKMLRLRLIVDRTAHLLMHGHLASEQASEIIQQTRSKVLELFPDKGDLFDLIYFPRFMRLFRDWG